MQNSINHFFPFNPKKLKNKINKLILNLGLNIQVIIEVNEVKISCPFWVFSSEINFSNLYKLETKREKKSKVFFSQIIDIISLIVLVNWLTFKLSKR